MPPLYDSASADLTIDVPSLRDRVADQLPLLRELLVVFREQYPTQFELIRESASRNDAEGLRKAAHRLIGTLACFSANRAVAAARKLERAAAQGDLASAAEGVAAIEREVAAVSQALDIIAERGFDALAGGENRR